MTGRGKIILWRMSPWNQGVPYEQFILVRKRYKNTSTKTFHKKRLLQKISRRHFFRKHYRENFTNSNTIWRVIHKSTGSYPQKSRFCLWITQKLYQNLYPVQQDIFKNKRRKNYITSKWNLIHFDLNFWIMAGQNCGSTVFIYFSRSRLIRAITIR